MRHYLRFTSMLLCALCLSGAAPLAPPAAPAQLRYAVHTLPATDRSLALAQTAGFDTVVELFSWRNIEPTKGEFHWESADAVVQGAAYYGLDLVVRLDQHPVWASPTTTALNAPPQNFEDYAAFAHTVARRYRGVVLGYIVWNEPNLAIDWGGQAPDPAAYTALLKAAHLAIKAADPDALVVSAGLAPTNERSHNAMDDRLFLQAMYDAGAAPHFDILGAHPYGFAYEPDAPAEAHDGLNLARVETLRAIMVANGDGDKPVWATEAGWTVEAARARAWQVVTPPQQADYLVGSYARAAREWPWLQMIAIWNLGGENNPEWSGYSILEATGRPRPAFTAIQALPKPARLPPRTAQLAARQQASRRFPVLAPDAVIHLGDTEYGRPWRPLYRVRNPSREWEGLVYVADPGTAPWTLTVRAMQSNEWGNAVWINGRRLEPTFGREDFGGSWVSQSWTAPAEWLQVGANTVRVTIGHTIPVMQDKGWRWDDLQVRDIILWQPPAAEP